MGGFILESRTIMESEIWHKPPLYFKIWHYLLMMASHKDHGNLKRGQLFTKVETIREACSYYVGYRKVMPTDRQVRQVLDWLRRPHEGEYEGRMILTTKVARGMVVTICNYNVYQDPKYYEGRTDSTHEGEYERETHVELYNKKGNKKEEYISSVNIYPKDIGEQLTDEDRDRLTDVYSDFEGLVAKVNERIKTRKRQTEIKDPYSYIVRAARDMEWPTKEAAEKKNAKRKKNLEEKAKAEKPPELTPEQKAKAKAIRERRRKNADG